MANHPPEEKEINQLKKALKDLVVFTNHHRGRTRCHPQTIPLQLQDPESQQKRTLESQPVHLVIFTCKDTNTSGSVDYQSKKLNFELYVLYSRAKLAILNSNHNRH